jgi:undecaprenyl pyrophosphate phosphatase UppP
MTGAAVLAAVSPGLSRSPSVISHALMKLIDRMHLGMTFPATMNEKSRRKSFPARL